jgi:hypothetical protein
MPALPAPLVSAAVSAAAFAGLVVGLVLLPTPVPLGLPLLAGSLALLVSRDLRFRRWLRSLRYRSRRLDARVYLLETRVRTLADWLAGPLRATRPSRRLRVRRRAGLRLR